MMIDQQMYEYLRKLHPRLPELDNPQMWVEDVVLEEVPRVIRRSPRLDDTAALETTEIVLSCQVKFRTARARNIKIR